MANINITDPQNEIADAVNEKDEVNTKFFISGCRPAYWRGKSAVWNESLV